MTTKELKHTIRSEIERQYATLKVEYAKTKGAYVAGRMDALDYIEQFIDSLPEENIRAQWKWIDQRYEYPLCLAREMDEYGDWHYSLSSGKISETCQYLSLAELERLPDEPVDADAAMKELDEQPTPEIPTLF